MPQTLILVDRKTRRVSLFLLSRPLATGSVVLRLFRDIPSSGNIPFPCPSPSYVHPLLSYIHPLPVSIPFLPMSIPFLPISIPFPCPSPSFLYPSPSRVHPLPSYINPLPMSITFLVQFFFYFTSMLCHNYSSTCTFSFNNPVYLTIVCFIGKKDYIVICDSTPFSINPNQSLGPNQCSECGLPVAPISHVMAVRN